MNWDGMTNHANPPLIMTRMNGIIGSATYVEHHEHTYTQVEVEKIVYQDPPRMVGLGLALERSGMRTSIAECVPGFAAYKSNQFQVAHKRTRTDLALLDTDLRLSSRQTDVKYSCTHI